MRGRSVRSTLWLGTARPSARLLLGRLSAVSCDCRWLFVLTMLSASLVVSASDSTMDCAYDASSADDDDEECSTATCAERF